MAIGVSIMNYLHTSVVKSSVRPAKVPVLWTLVNWSVVQAQQREQRSSTFQSDSMATLKPIRVDLNPGTFGSKEEFYDKHESIQNCPIEKCKTPLTPFSQPIPSIESSNLMVLAIG